MDFFYYIRKKKNELLMIRHLFVFILISISIELVGQKPFDTGYFIMPKEITTNDYIAKTVIFKVIPSLRGDCKANQINNNELNKVFSFYGETSLLKKFPLKQQPEKQFNELGEKLVDLSLIYEFTYTSDSKIEDVVNSIIATGLAEYAQPHYIQQLLYTPNDPFITSHQYYLRKINAFNAWNLSQGDTNIVIGIIDTGTDLLHPDLLGNLKYNYYDPIDGIDNDNDGYIDNYYGWNLGCNNNNPQVDPIVTSGCHGVHVNGIASATTDNGTGIAGVGFKCKFLPIRVTDATGVITMGYEGIVYAVDHGCSVVNCSWGNAFTAGAYGQDIVNYAAVNMNAIVVAAAGNILAPLNYYPASYDNVISVGRTDSVDVLIGSYSPNIDICAPGAFIYSTWCGGGYVSSGGSSMSSPIIAGCAGILKIYFPSYNALQIIEQLKVTADIVDTISANHIYRELMGSGRVNLYNALTKTNLPSIRMVRQYKTPVQYGLYSKNDTIPITCDFLNCLQPTSNLRVSITSSSPYVNIIDSIVNLGIINTLQTKNNLNNPFKVKILQNIPVSQSIQFKLKYTDTGYSAIQFFSIVVNTDYIDIDTNLITTTFTSIGKLGFNDPSNIKGQGFLYNNGKTLMYCGGLLIGNTTNQVSDNIYSAIGNYDNDFKPLLNAKKILPPIVSDLDLKCVFSDSLAGTQQLNILVTNKAYAWNSTKDKKYIIYEFTIKNIGLLPLNSLYAGFYVDWDIGNSIKNRIQYDATRKMGYTYSINGGTNTAICLLTDVLAKHYAFDNDGSDNGQTNSIKISDGFTNYEKYTALKTNRNIAGYYVNGNDVSDMISSGPYILLAGDSIIVAYALIAGDHLADIQSSADAAYLKYHNIQSISNIHSTNIQLNQNFPNPFNFKTSINFYLPETSFVDLSVYNVLGEKVATIVNKNLNSGNYSYPFDAENMKEGVYYYRLYYGDNNISKKMIIIK